MLEPEAVTTIVRLGQSGWGAKRIARALGIARNTVRRYRNAGGPVPYRQPQRARVLGSHEAWLRERFLQHRGNCDVVRQQLSKELGIDTSLRTVERACRGFRQELEARRRATIRFETAPGEQMQIDLVNTPRRSRWVVMSRKNRSIMLSQDTLAAPISAPTRALSGFRLVTSRSACLAAASASSMHFKISRPTLGPTRSALQPVTAPNMASADS
jgi:transposase